MWKLTSNPTAGYILNVGGAGAAPGSPSSSDRDLLRTLAEQVREIAALPVQEEKRELWYSHNALKPTRPLVLVFLEDSWDEALPAEGNLSIADPFWRQWEWYLRHLRYRHARLDDDFVIEPHIYVPRQLKIGDWGLPPAEVAHSDDPRGSFRWTPPLQKPEDIARLTPATIGVDHEPTDRVVSALTDAVGDILPVHVHCAPSSFCIIDIATHLRGTEQLMLDMYDRPDWLHQLMDFLGAEELRRRQFLEENGYLTLNNRNHYVDSGSIGYSHELPGRSSHPQGGPRPPGAVSDESCTSQAPDAARRSASTSAPHPSPSTSLHDLWAHAAAQAASEIGPDQHEEFILEHELPILDQAGLVSYGCCEPYTRKFDMLKRRVPRLRRVSVSPWCDVATAAEALEDKIIFSWKPNPAMLVGNFDEERIRSYVRETLDVARDCCLEIILKDAITLDGEPGRVERWLKIVNDEIGKL